MSKIVERLHPFEVDGHRVAAWTSSGNVSASGAAIPSQVTWKIEIDRYLQIGADLEAHVDDTEEFVRDRIVAKVREHLRARA